jgi:hypothetical protein
MDEIKMYFQIKTVPSKLMFKMKGIQETLTKHVITLRLNIFIHIRKANKWDKHNLKKTAFWVLQRVVGGLVTETSGGF